MNEANPPTPPENNEIPIIPQEGLGPNHETLGPSSMYEVPGHEAIDRHHLNRYEAAQKRWDQDIRHLAGIEIHLKGVANTPDKEQAELIREALDNTAIEVQAVVEMIRCAPYNEQAELIREALKNPAIEVQIAAAEMIEYAPDKERAELIREALKNPAIEVQIAAVKMIGCAPYNEQAELIREVLGNPAIEVQIAAVGMIRYVQNKKRAELIREALKNPAIEVQRAAVKMIEYAPINEKAELIREALKNPAIEVQAAVEMIWYAPDDERAELIREALKNPAIEVQRAAAEIIECAPDNEQADLQRIVGEKIREALGNPAIEVQRAATEMIEYAPDDERAELVDQAIEKQLGTTLIEPPLYDSGNVSERFSRTAFPKTGSETTLIGGELRGKIIIRHISAESFLTWKDLYEDWSFWREEGFDYVPIEPIVSYRLEKSGNVAVSSGVLDLSLARWQKMTPRFGSELETQKRKILAALVKKGVTHGHEHDANFCLRFFRDEDGRPDMTKEPRLYLIDFDQAVSP